jgi:hypothetical protein
MWEGDKFGGFFADRCERRIAVWIASLDTAFCQYARLAGNQEVEYLWRDSPWRRMWMMGSGVVVIVLLST